MVSRSSNAADVQIVHSGLLASEAKAAFFFKVFGMAFTLITVNDGIGDIEIQRRGCHRVIVVPHTLSCVDGSNGTYICVSGRFLIMNAYMPYW